MNQMQVGGWEAAEPPREGLRIEWVIDRFSGERAIGSISHPGRAWCAPLGDPFERGQREEVGWLYLAAVAKAAGLDGSKAGWLHPSLLERLNPGQQGRDALDKHPGLGFGWLALTWRGPVSRPSLPDGTGPMGSFWISRARRRVVSGKPKGTLVLLAGNVATDHQLQFGADLGLRIVMHVAAGRACIHGVTLASVCTDRALHAVPECAGALLAPRGLRPFKQAIGQALIDGRVPEGGSEVEYRPDTFKPDIHRPDIYRPDIWIHSIERSLEPAAPDGRYSVIGVAARGRRAGRGGGSELTRSRIHDFRVEVEHVAGATRVVHIHRDDYLGSTARVWREVRAFETDPASQPPPDAVTGRRPSAAEDDLDKFRRPIVLNLDVASQGAGEPLLRYSQGQTWFETRTARRGPADGVQPPTVPDLEGAVALPAAPKPARRAPKANADANAVALEPPIRSDEQGSIDAHVRASELFERMQAYGLAPEAYFRFARLPLVQRARPAMTWAPDGDLPNAEVRPFIGEAEPAAPGQAAKPVLRLRDRVQLLVRYGSASPFHRHKREVAHNPDANPGAKPIPGGPSRLRRKAQYLSVACDARWAWHEFGHVLAFAGTGELELPFAHGAGDALGAIAADPRSHLAVGDPEAPARFITFPWIEVPGRSHGRRALEEGYCWCGARNRVRLNFEAPIERYHHSYFGEQLMSSSLFRLYRSLGGDTRAAGADESTKPAKADLQMRLEASDYCIYLVMYALSLLGPDSVAPAQTAEQFVGAMIDADLGTGAWSVEADWPFVDLGIPRRLMSRSGGRVHKVIRWAFERQGLYGADEPRATAEGPGQPPAVDVYIADRRSDRRPDGGPDSEPGGYAPVPLRCEGDEPAPWHAQANAVKVSGQKIVVQVGNRGAEAARGTVVHAWWRTRDAEGWKPLEGASPAAEVRPDDHTAFEFARPKEAPGPIWVLALADAPADPANLRPTAAPPTGPRELMELVAHDNNLALARL